MKKYICEVEIIHPGRPVGQYSSTDSDTLRLDKILYPETPRPFDLAATTDMLTSTGEQIPVILLGEVSHPPNTQVQARLLGAVQNCQSEPYLLAVPTADPSYADGMQIDDLGDSLRLQINQYLAHDGGEPSWLNLEAIEPLIQASYLNYLKAKAADSKLENPRPAWQPLESYKRTIGYTEAEHYTEAEYTYFQLPRRFQYYMENHLASDERILYAIHKPSMRSRRQRAWIGRKILQESVLILTNQRLIHLAELIPPDTSGVRYGFEARVGVVERLAQVGLERLGDDALLLHTQWQARNGVQSVEWEFPLQNWSALEELIAILKGFIPESHRTSALQRATLPPPPDKLIHAPLHSTWGSSPGDNHCIPIPCSRGLSRMFRMVEARYGCSPVNPG